MAFPTLQTNRLLLRELHMGDHVSLFHIFADAEVTRFYNLQRFKTMEDSLALLEKRRGRFWRGKGINWAITLPPSNTLIGCCGFNAWRQGGVVGEIGYELARPFWNQGIMTEALHAILHYGFKTVNLQKIEAWVLPENGASARVLAKLGFKSLGVREGKGYWGGRFHDLEHFLLESLPATTQEMG